MRTEYGELVSCVLANSFRFNVIYRRPEQQAIADYDACMEWFSSTYDIKLPTFYVGDFNWEVFRPQV